MRSPPFDLKNTSGNTKMKVLHRKLPCKIELDEINAVSGSSCIFIELRFIQTESFVLLRFMSLTAMPNNSGSH